MSAFLSPPPLARAIGLAIRAAHAESMARRDAALIARIERAYCRAHGIDGRERNDRAGRAAERFVKSWKFQQTGGA